MRALHTGPRRVGLIVAAVGLVGGTLSAVSPAQASTAQASTAQASTAQASTTRPATAVSRSGAVLAAATAKLNSSVRVAGTAWAVDPAADQVVITADSTVTGAKLRRVKKVAAGLGSTVRVNRVSGRLTPKLSGGDPIYGGGYRCSVGFNVRSGSSYYFLTAGHCGNIASTWYRDAGQSSPVGSTSDSRFPGTDWAIVAYAPGVSHPGNVNLYNGGYQDITTAGNAYVGEYVRRSGSTTGVHGGTVTGLNATVNYAEGTVHGLIQTTVCAEGGDSGGPLFSGSTALGLTSGGSGNCSTGGTTFFQPVGPVLNTYGVDVY